MIVSLALLCAAQELEGFEGPRSATEVYPKWEAVRDGDHPHYNEIDVVDDPTRARSGRSFLRFRSQGGTTAFQQRLKYTYVVSGNREYTLSGHARIVPAKPQERPRMNVAHLELRWLGRKGEVLRIDRSGEIAAADAWTPLSLEVTSVPPDAVGAQVRLNLEGPDMRAECHFDDLRLESRPRIGIEIVGRTLPVYRPSETATLRLRIPERGEASLRLTVRNAEDSPLLPERTVSLDDEGTHTERVSLPDAGYYELQVDLVEAGDLRATKILPLLCVEPFRFRPEHGRTLGLTINPFRESVRHLGALAQLLGLRRAKIVAWDHPTVKRPAPPEPAEILALVREASQAEETVFTGVLAHPPVTLFPDLEPSLLRSGPFALFGQDRRIWEAELRKIVERYRELLREWQIGGDDDERAVHASSADKILSLIGDEIRAASPGARVGVPIASSDVPRIGLPHAQFFSVSTRAWEDPERFSQPIEATKAELRLSLDPPTGDRRHQAAHLLKRLVYLATADRPLAAYLPFTSEPRTGLVDSDGRPTALALAFRCANDLLSDARYRRNLHLFTPPVRDFVFEKQGETFIVLWSESGSHTLELPLEHKGRVLRPLGPPTPLAPGEKFEVGPFPVFLVGIDDRLLQTQLSLQWHRDSPDAPVDSSLPLRADSPPKRLRLTNHFPEALHHLRMRIVDPIPSGWTIHPRELKRSTLRSGETLDQPLRIGFPLTEREGFYDVTIELTFEREVDGETKRHTWVVRRSLALIPEIEVLAKVEKDGPKRRVRLWVRNRTDRTLNLRGWLRIPGAPDRAIALAGLQGETDQELDVVEVTSETGFRNQWLEIQLEEKGVFVNKAIALEP